MSSLNTATASIESALRSDVDPLSPLVGQAPLLMVGCGWTVTRTTFAPNSRTTTDRDDALQDYEARRNEVTANGVRLTGAPALPRVLGIEDVWSREPSRV